MNIVDEGVSVRKVRLTSEALLDRAIRALAMLGFLVLLSLAVAVAAHFRLFPYPMVEQAIQAGTGWLALLRGMPATFKQFTATALESPTGLAVSGTSAANEPILIGGGPFEYLEACPTNGCLAWIVDRQGRLLHQWEVDPQPILDGMTVVGGEVSARKLKPHDWHLQPNGDLLVIFENNGAFPYGGAVARFDWEGRLLGVTHNGAHHWMTVDDDGKMYMPINRAVEATLSLDGRFLNLTCTSGGIELDYVQIVDRAGQPLETINLLERLIESGFTGLIYATFDPCDPLHLNFVQHVDRTLASSSGLEVGDLIVSMRNINAVAILAADDRRVKWLLAGRTTRQHSPRIATDGSLLIFDNFGGSAVGGGSRIARLRWPSQDVETLFPLLDSGEDGFFSRVGGLMVQHPSQSRILVTLTDSGRIVEIDTKKARSCGSM
jgi:hypothetical protein